MITRYSPLIAQIMAQDPQTLHAELQAAEEAARQPATALRRGIRVTQHDYTTYTVAITAEVPHGQTVERRQWNPN